MSMFDQNYQQALNAHYAQSAVGQLASKASLFSLPTQFLTSPLFWTKFLEVAAQTTEKAAPDYTIGHKIAAVVDHLLTGSTIHTPDKAHAESVVQALGEAVKALAPTVVQVVKP